MRYQNWDILIFPDRSKVPLQEFKAQCLVSRNEGKFSKGPQLAGAGPSTIYSSDGKAFSHLPIVTSFIGSLAHGDDFRISIHSWDRPKPSKALESLMQLDDTVTFEARVYLDGVLKTRTLFDHRTLWPFVIDTAGPEHIGESEPLRFPMFHPEILKQDHWDAGDSYGRVKIIIAEGLCRQLRATDARAPAFERFGDVVGFAFQHAPLNVLEFSGIAWPNELMWKQARKLPAQPDPYTPKPSIVPDHDSHAHSPRRASLLDRPAGPVYCNHNPGECAYRGCNYLRHFASPQHHIPARPAPSSTYAGNMVPPAYTYNPGMRNATGAVDDPFLVSSGPTADQKTFEGKQTQSSSHDISMSDYRSGGSRPPTEMSGVSYNRLDFERQVNNAAVQELVKALSPMKQRELLEAMSSPNETTRSGSVPPENSPAEAASIAPLRSKVATCDKIHTDYDDLDSGEYSRDQSPPTSRTTSNDDPPLPFSRAKFGSASPADSIQSKKERRRTQRSLEQSTSDHTSSVEKLASKSRSPLVETLNLNRQRSDSAGSKRKRSNSKLDQVTSALHPASSGAKAVDSDSGMHSPSNVVGEKDTPVSSRRRSLRLT